MPENPCEKPCWRPRLIITDVWQTCEKIRAGVYRAGLNLWGCFRILDPNNNCLISEAQFVSVLAGPLKETIGLTSNEIAQLADYFRVYDGRIYYTQFCELIHGNEPNACQNPPLVTGLESSHPCALSSLNSIEEAKIRMLLTKIATLVNRRHLVLSPYFQDYELIAKSAGVITRNHFARVLAYLNIRVSADEFLLLVKKFGRDSYTVDYATFVSALDQVICALREQGALDVGGDLLPHFPGHALCAPLPQLPRPELTAACPRPPRPVELCDTLRRVMCFALKHHVCVDAFFKAFDALGCGRVTEAQFRRCLDKMLACAPQRFMLSAEEVDRLVAAYRAPNDPDRVCYCLFEDDLSHVLSPEEAAVCRRPEPRAPRPGAQDEDPRHVLPQHSRSVCEETIFKMRQRVCKRRLHLKPSFMQYDPKDSGHVSVPQMRHALMTLGVLLTSFELDALLTRFCDDMGFNYRWFITEIEPTDAGEIRTEKYIQAKLESDPKPYPVPSPTIAERDIVEILAKIKCKMVRGGSPVLGALRALDGAGEGSVAREAFCQGVGEALGLRLTALEMETLMDAFGVDGRPERVDYKRFADAVEKALGQPCLERAPMVPPLEQVPRPDNCRNFLNFEERYRVGRAMQKLGERPYLDLERCFVVHDHCRAGLVTPQQFRCVMHQHGLCHLLSTPEVSALVKCFGVRRGIDDDIDYRAFCHAVKILQVNRRRRVL